MRFSKLVLLVFIIVLGLCGSPATGQERSTQPALQPNMLVTSEWLQPRLSSRGVVIIDVVNSLNEYADGHVPGAVVLPIGELVTQCEGSPNELPRIAELELLFGRLGVGTRKRIVLYSRDEILAARAWFTLDYLGQGARTSVLDGGLAKWIQEKRPVTTTPTQPQRADFFARPRPQVVARTPAVMEISNLLTTSITNRVALVDVRSADAFLGTRADAGITRPGHISGATNVPWVENFTTGFPRVLRPAEELRKLYGTAWVGPEKTTVVYCRSGMQASVAYFALRYLGYPVHLYDGSYIEWSESKGAPVDEPPGD